MVIKSEIFTTLFFLFSTGVIGRLNPKAEIIDFAKKSKNFLTIDFPMIMFCHVKRYSLETRKGIHFVE